MDDPDAPMVLKTQRSHQNRDRQEPTGQAESLSDKVQKFKWGTRSKASLSTQDKKYLASVDSVAHQDMSAPKSKIQSRLENVTSVANVVDEQQNQPQSFSMDTSPDSNSNQFVDSAMNLDFTEENQFESEDDDTDSDDDFGFPSEHYIPSSKQQLNLESGTYQQINLEKYAKEPRGASHSADSELPLDPSDIHLENGYKEISIPAKSPSPLEDGESLVRIESLPQWAQLAFSGYETLNRVQSRIHKKALFDDSNFLLCAPTGAGKTNVALMAILHEIQKHLIDNQLQLDKFKIIYIAPMKSLAREMRNTFEKRLKPFNITVSELTGDIQLSKSQIMDSQMIITTPEKWDVVTRKTGEKQYQKLVKLMILDEIHLLHDERGPVLESLVVRATDPTITYGSPIRLCGLSATLPNFKDVASFLNCTPDDIFHFDGSFRPVPLSLDLVGTTVSGGQSYSVMNQITYEKVLEVVKNNKQALIFVHSRKETLKTAQLLYEMAIEHETLGYFCRPESESETRLKNAAGEGSDGNDSKSEQISYSDLKTYLAGGFGCHHAGMNRKDRSIIEDLFTQSHLPVLVSTATLAWGVNTPAHTVIIKGTKVFSPSLGSWTQLSHLDTLQMLGRAGRPQYDKTGHGIILTEDSTLPFYFKMLTSQLPVESQMYSRIIDSLNAECVLGTIVTFDDALSWLKKTYLYQRMINSPKIYEIHPSIVLQDPELLSHRQNIIFTALTLLSQSKLVELDDPLNPTRITPTPLGRIASYFYIHHKSMRMYDEYMSSNMSWIDIFRLFSMSHEFSDMSIRPAEVDEIQRLYAAAPIPIRESTTDNITKPNLLCQAYISRIQMDGFVLQSEMVNIVQNAGRIFRALYSLALSKGLAKTANKCLDFCLMIENQQWIIENPLKQFFKKTIIAQGVEKQLINVDLMNRIESRKISWQAFQSLTKQDLTSWLNSSKLANRVMLLRKAIPQVSTSIRVMPVTHDILKFQIRITPVLSYHPQIHPKQSTFWIFVEDVSNKHLLYSQFFSLDIFKKKTLSLEFTAKCLLPLNHHYIIRFRSDRWIGSNTTIPYMLHSFLPPGKDIEPSILIPKKPKKWSDYGDSKLFTNPDDFVGPYTQNGFKIEDIRNTSTSSSTQQNLTKIFFCPDFQQSINAIVLSLLKKRVKPSTIVVVDSSVLACVVTKNLESICTNQQISFIENDASQLLAQLVQQDSGSPVFVIDSVLFSHLIFHCISNKTLPKQLGHTIFLNTTHLSVEMEILCILWHNYIQPASNNIETLFLGTPCRNAQDFANWLDVPLKPPMFYNFPPSIGEPIKKQFVAFDSSSWTTRLFSMRRPAYLAMKNWNSGIIFIPTHAKCINFAQEFSQVRKTTVAVLSSKMKSKAVLQVNQGYQQGKIKFLIVDSTCVHRFSNLKNDNILIMETCIKESGSLSDIGFLEIYKILNMAQKQCIVFGHISRTNYINQCFSSDLPPIESLSINLLNEILYKAVDLRIVLNIQEALNFTTLTFLYQRLVQNPSYYGLHSRSPELLSEFLSELVQQAIEKHPRLSLASDDVDGDTEILISAELNQP